MSDPGRRFTSQTLPIVIGAFVLGAVIVGVIWGVVASVHGGQTAAVQPTRTSTHSATPKATASAGVAPSTASVACGVKGTTVSTADGLQSALDNAKPGSTILLKSGTYIGNFEASVSGTVSQPITVCGPKDAVLDGNTIDKNYVFHLDHASYWKLLGFTVQNGQKGVVTDGSVGSLIQGLTVTDIGDEGIHLRDFSTDNTVDGNTVSGTGKLRAKYGEGIYIGSAVSNWGEYSGGNPDASDRNVISDNTISDTTAESVDIKEGTSDGVLKGNTFDGSALQEKGADSWVDVKGDGWVISGNTGTNSPNDGFQTHQIVKGMGTDNVFSNNVAHVNGPGYGFSLTPVLGNIVECNNTVTGAASGTANVSCSGG
jgi:parallel beta-helix repeat protein